MPPAPATDQAAIRRVYREYKPPRLMKLTVQLPPELVDVQAARLASLELECLSEMPVSWVVSEAIRRYSLDVDAETLLGDATIEGLRLVLGKTNKELDLSADIGDAVPDGCTLSLCLTGELPGATPATDPDGAAARTRRATPRDGLRNSAQDEAKRGAAKEDADAMLIRLRELREKNDGPPAAPLLEGLLNRVTAVEMDASETKLKGAPTDTMYEVDVLPSADPFFAADAAAPSDDLAAVAAMLGAADWTKQFVAIDGLRRLVLRHRDDAAVAAGLDALLEPLCARAHELRSTVSRNALFCLGDIFSTCGGTAFPHARLAVTTCIDMSGSSAKFIQAAAVDTLDTLAAHGPAEVAVAATAGFAASANRDCQLHAMQCLDRILERVGIGAGSKSKADGGAAELDEAALTALIVPLSKGLRSKAAGSKTACKGACTKLKLHFGEKALESKTRKALGIGKEAEIATFLAAASGAAPAKKTYPKFKPPTKKPSSASRPATPKPLSRRPSKSAASDSKPPARAAAKAAPKRKMSAAKRAAKRAAEEKAAEAAAVADHSLPDWTCEKTMPARPTGMWRGKVLGEAAARLGIHGKEVKLEFTKHDMWLAPSQLTLAPVAAVFTLVSPAAGSGPPAPAAHLDLDLAFPPSYGAGTVPAVLSYDAKGRMRLELPVVGVGAPLVRPAGPTDGAAAVVWQLERWDGAMEVKKKRVMGTSKKFAAIATIKQMYDPMNEASKALRAALAAADEAPEEAGAEADEALGAADDAEEASAALRADDDGVGLDLCVRVWHLKLKYHVPARAVTHAAPWVVVRIEALMSRLAEEFPGSKGALGKIDFVRDEMDNEGDGKLCDMVEWLKDRCEMAGWQVSELGALGQEVSAGSDDEVELSAGQGRSLQPKSKKDDGEGGGVLLTDTPFGASFEGSPPRLVRAARLRRLLASVSNERVVSVGLGEDDSTRAAHAEANKPGTAYSVADPALLAVMRAKQVGHLDALEAQWLHKHGVKPAGAAAAGAAPPPEAGGNGVRMIGVGFLAVPAMTDAQHVTARTKRLATLAKQSKASVKEEKELKRSASIKNAYKTSGAKELSKMRIKRLRALLPPKDASANGVKVNATVPLKQYGKGPASMTVHKAPPKRTREKRCVWLVAAAAAAAKVKPTDPGATMNDDVAVGGGKGKDKMSEEEREMLEILKGIGGTGSAPAPVQEAAPVKGMSAAEAMRVARLRRFAKAAGG